jgi:hypothetical protein
MEDIHTSDEWKVTAYLETLIDVGVKVPTDVYEASKRLKTAKARSFQVRWGKPAITYSR